MGRRRHLEKLEHAIGELDDGTMRKLLDKHPELAREPDPMTMAISTENLTAVRELLARGADANGMVPGFDEPFLYRAAGHDPSPRAVELVQVLLAAGADANARTAHTGETPLMEAVRHAANLSPESQQGALEAWGDLARLLGSAAGAAEPATAASGPDAEGSAAPEEDDVAARAVVVEALLAAGADLEQKDAEGATALDRADEALAQHLVSLGATDRRIDSQLLSAVEEGRLEDVRRLLADGADPDRALPGSGSALCAAARDGRVAVLEALLEAGARPDGAGGPESHTPLTLAAYSGHLDVVRRLLAAGADPARPGIGRRPFSWAREGQETGQGGGESGSWEELFALLEAQPAEAASRRLGPMTPSELGTALEAILGPDVAGLPAKDWKSGRVDGATCLESPPLGAGLDADRILRAARASGWHAVFVGWSLDEAPELRPGETCASERGTELLDQKVREMVEELEEELEEILEEDYDAEEEGNLLPGLKDGPIPSPRNEVAPIGTSQRRLVLTDGEPERIALFWGFGQDDVYPGDMSSVFLSWRERFGATLVYFDGDTAMFDLPSPLTREPDVRRAALELLAIDLEVAYAAEELLQMVVGRRWLLWWD